MNQEIDLPLQGAVNAVAVAKEIHNYYVDHLHQREIQPIIWAMALLIEASISAGALAITYEALGLDPQPPDYWLTVFKDMLIEAYKP